MKAKELRDIAARLNRIADEMEGIKADGGAIKVKLPQPDLFSQMGIADDDMIERATQALTTKAPQLHSDVNPISYPVRRIYKRVGCKMRDEAIVSANKVGRAQGYCQRSDIERSMRRDFQYRTREEIREAVNAAVAELGLTCIVFNSYRFYRRADRKRILETATKNLNPIEL